MSENGTASRKNIGIIGSVFAWFDRVLESKTSANLLIVALVLLSAIPLTGIGLFATLPVAPDVFVAGTKIREAVNGATAVFSCDSGRVITAVFSGDGVHLVLSDGRKIVLPQQALAVSETSFGNADGSFVFSDNGAAASIEENGAATYSGCVPSND